MGGVSGAFADSAGNAEVRELGGGRGVDDEDAAGGAGKKKKRELGSNWYASITPGNTDIFDALAPPFADRGYWRLFYQGVEQTLRSWRKDGYGRALRELLLVAWEVCHWEATWKEAPEETMELIKSIPDKSGMEEEE